MDSREAPVPVQEQRGLPERTKAVMGTLLRNPNIKIDAAVAAAAGALGTYAGGPEVGGIMAALSFLIRPAIQQLGESGARQQAFRNDVSSFSQPDLRSTPELVVAAWKKGTAEMPQANPAALDSRDTYDRIHKK